MNNKNPIEELDELITKYHYAESSVENSAYARGWENSRHVAADELEEISKKLNFFVLGLNNLVTELKNSEVYTPAISYDSGYKVGCSTSSVKLKTLLKKHNLKTE